jgi:hypothetical protein
MRASTIITRMAVIFSCSSIGGLLVVLSGLQDPIIALVGAGAGALVGYWVPLEK